MVEFLFSCIEIASQGCIFEMMKSSVERSMINERLMIHLSQPGGKRSTLVFQRADP